MQENISERNGFIRLALGTGLTAFGIAHLTKESGSKTLGSALVIAGAMKVAEGAFLYCPTKALINSNVKEAVYTSFDEYLDGDSLFRAYNDAYQSRWGNTPSNNRYSWSEGGIAKAASEAMDAISKGEDFSNVVQSFNNSQTSQSSAQASTKSNNSTSNHQKSNNHYNKSKTTNSGRTTINPS